MTNYPAHMLPIEARIITSLINSCLREGWEIRVHDSEEFATDWTTDLDVIRPQIAATDMTVLCVRETTPEGGKVRLGQYVLVHGNEEDVLSDVQAANDTSLDRLEKIASAS